MMRNAAAVLAAIFCLVTSQVHALGLGTISLESSLNQPLRARIEIIDLGSVSPADISIQMATQQDFERFDLERSAFLSGVNFDIQRTADGVFVLLTSSQAVREPFLNFILDTRWPSGRILSEHTVLLDLPVFSENQSVAQPIDQPVSPVVEQDQGVVDREPVTPQSTTSVDNAAEEQIAADNEPAPVTSATVDDDQVVSGSTLRRDSLEIQELDTLWEIAMRVRPDTSVTVQQTMLAIQRLNPDAFADGNINRLIAGETLQVPDLSDIRSINQQQAVSEVSRQNQQADLSAQPLSAPSAGPSSLASAASQGQLRVLTTEDAQPVTGGSSAAVEAENAQLDAEILALETQLLLQQEEADRVRIQQAEMISRLDDLDAQIASAMEIIRLQDQQLAQLQESLAAAQAQAAVQQDAAETAPATLTRSQPLQTTSPSFLDSVLRVLSNNSLVLIIVSVLVVVLMVMLLMRRNRLATAEGYSEEFTDDMSAGTVDRSSVDAEPLSTAEFDIPDQYRKDEEAVAEVAELASAAMADDVFGIEETDIDELVSDTKRQQQEEDFDREDFDQDFGNDDEEEIEGQADDETVWQTKAESAASETGFDETGFDTGNELSDEAELEAIDEPADDVVDFELDTELDQGDEEDADLDVVDFDIDEFLDEDDNLQEAAGAGGDVAKASGQADEAVDFDLGNEVEDDIDESAADSEALDLDAVDFAVDADVADDDADAIEALDLEDDEISGDDHAAVTEDGAADQVTRHGNGETDDFIDSEETDEIETLDFDLSDTGIEDFEEETGGDQVDVSSAADDEVESFDFDLTEAVDEVGQQDESPEMTDSQTAVKEPDEVDLGAATDDLPDEDDRQDESASADDAGADATPVADKEDSLVPQPAAAVSATADADEGPENTADSIEFDLDGTATAELPDFEDELAEDTAGDRANAEPTGDQVTGIDFEEPAANDLENSDADDDGSGDDGQDRQIGAARQNSSEPDDVLAVLEQDEEAAAPDTAIELDNLDFLSADDDSAVDGADEEIEFLSDDDEAATKLDLAYAYQKMGDVNGAKEILEEVINEGNDAQVNEARTLIAALGK